MSDLTESVRRSYGVLWQKQRRARIEVVVQQIFDNISGRSGLDICSNC